MAVKTIVSVIGARPQFIKAAPVSRALAPVFKEVLIHTGQHYDFSMSDLFFEELGIRPPDLNLGIGSGSHGEQTGRMLIELENALTTLKPDCVMVYGDTNSTLAGALTAAKMQIPIAHVEAGLRSYNRDMPEEINRVVCDHLSALLFCPTVNAVKNLASEGISKGVHNVGDVMYDAMRYDLTIARKQPNVLKRLGLVKYQYAMVTFHRAGNTDNVDRMMAIMHALGQLKTTVMFPVHPRTKRTLTESNLPVSPNVRMIEPVGHLDMLILEENANCILTDSGGIQKEAYLLGTRCITLREETEWVETVTAGWNKLTGVSPDAIRTAFETWFPAGERPALYGDGHAAEKIREVLLTSLLQGTA